MEIRPSTRTQCSAHRNRTHFFNQSEKYTRNDVHLLKRPFFHPPTSSSAHHLKKNKQKKNVCDLRQEPQSCESWWIFKWRFSSLTGLSVWSIYYRCVLSGSLFTKIRFYIMPCPCVRRGGPHLATVMLLKNRARVLEQDWIIKNKQTGRRAKIDVAKL